MHLLTEAWLTVTRRDGSLDCIRPSNIVSKDNVPVDLIATRPDFRGALYQFLIGLLQTAYAPDDLDEWHVRWRHPPAEADLSKAFGRYADAFQLDCDSPAFMQDFKLPDGEIKPIAALLIDAPGGKTIQDNLDHFIKRETVGAMCPACAATALFALQINAPSGGVGHRVSLRGGGPLTTLVLPVDENSSLWQKLWLNVLPKSAFSTDALANNRSQDSDIFPWLAATRVSDTKGTDTTPDLAHPLQAYWSMPRRVRLDFADTHAGRCEMCGNDCNRLISRYRTKNYGVNYTGTWMHPLSPYNLDAKNEKPPLSVKGQRGGIAYRHWLGLALGSDDHQPDAAQVVRDFNRKADDLSGKECDMRLWCFGYDMDNMKARCWYDATLPLYSVSPSCLRPFQHAIHNLLDVAKEAAGLLGKHVKAARFSRPADAGNDPSVPQSFWQATEPVFYGLLQKLAAAKSLNEPDLALIYRSWLGTVRGQTIELFDDWVLAAPIEEMEMRRVVKARIDLKKWLSVAKPMKELSKIVNAYAKEKV